MMGRVSQMVIKTRVGLDQIPDPEGNRYSERTIVQATDHLIHRVHKFNSLMQITCKIVPTHQQYSIGFQQV